MLDDIRVEAYVDPFISDTSPKHPILPVLGSGPEYEPVVLNTSSRPDPPQVSLVAPEQGMLHDVAGITPGEYKLLPQ